MKTMSTLLCMFLLAMTLGVLGCGGDAAEAPKTPEQIRKEVTAEAQNEITAETLEAEKQKLIADINLDTE